MRAAVELSIANREMHHIPSYPLSGNARRNGAPVERLRLGKIATRQTEVSGNSQGLRRNFLRRAVVRIRFGPFVLDLDTRQLTSSCCFGTHTLIAPPTTPGRLMHEMPRSGWP